MILKKNLFEKPVTGRLLDKQAIPCYNHARLNKFICIGMGIIVFSAFLPVLFQLLRPEWTGLAYLPFRELCHQQSARSFAIAGTPLAVCARCLGIFGGIWFAGLLITFSRIATLIPTGWAKWIFSITLAANSGQFVIEFVTGWPVSNIFRLILGICAGISLMLYLAEMQISNR